MPRLALQGIRIVDNGIVQAGTFPARLLADFGAEVVRVENYRRPDVSRNAVFPAGRAEDPYWEGGGTYHEQFRNKRFCVGLDVRKPSGREAFLRLVAVSDIVLDSHPPGVMEKLHLDYEALKLVNPRIIYISTSGYGYGGPYETVRSYGMMTEVMCGSGWLNGYPGEGPRRGACPLTDHPATFHIAFLLISALIKCRRTGEGSWIDISQYEIGTNILGDAHLANIIGAPVPAQAGSVDPASAFSGCFRSEGPDDWVAVSVPSQSAWQGLCDTVGLDATWRTRDVFSDRLDQAEHNAVVQSLTAWMSSRQKAAAFVELGRAGVAAAPVNSVRDLLLDPHLADRGFYWSVQQAPEQNAGLRAWPGASARMSATPAEFRYPAPMLGEHNREVALSIMAFTEDEYEAMAAEGAFGKKPDAAAMKPPPQDVAARVALDPAAAAGRAREVDLQHLDRLRGRYGTDYGR
ncbi:MAG: CoA transferase [Dehalococcoidia bacterium]|nr:CoA transferase [Dehalococcoidia bacterium]MCB9484492.1 CoA transferase [Thermoflexaceae bacterium]